MSGVKNTAQLSWERFAFAALAFGFCLGFLSLTYAAVSLRPLVSDGANFMHHAVSMKWFMMDPDFARYIDWIPQAPAIFYMWLGGQEFPAIRALFLFSYSWIGVLATLASVWLCFHYEKPYAAVGPLLSFGLVYLPTAVFSLSISGLSALFFWPLFLLQVYGTNSRAEIFFTGLLILVLSFAHETTLLALAVLTGLALLQGRSWLALAYGVSIGGYLYRLRSVDSGMKAYIFEQLLTLNFFQEFLMLFLSVAVVCVALARFGGKKISGASFWLFALVSISLVCWLVSQAPIRGGFTIPQAIGNRLTITTFVAMIGLLCWLSDPSIPSVFARFRTAMDEKWSRGFCVVTLAALLFGSGLDFYFTREWRGGMTKLRAYAAERAQSSCLFVEREFFLQNLYRVGVCDFCFSHYWSMIQPSWRVDQFLWINPVPIDSAPAEGVCERLNDHAGYIETHPYLPRLPVTGSAFDYRFLRRAPPAGRPRSAK